MQMEVELETTLMKVRRVSGEVFSQLLNVPMLSAALVTYFYFNLPSTEPNRLSGYLWSLVYLTVVPLFSLFFYIPFKNDSRELTLHRQRVSSFVFMLVSYPIGWIMLSWTHAPVIFIAMAEIYTFVTLGLVVINLFMHYKASGHAAGVSGPVASMIYLFGAVATPLLALLPLITWARMAAKGHNFWQTVVGATLSSLISVVVLWGLGFIPFAGMLSFK